MTTRTTPEGVPDLPPLHPAWTLLTTLVLGVAGLALPAGLAQAYPSGLEMVDGVVQYSPEAPGAKLRGDGGTGGMVALNDIPAGSDEKRQFVVGLFFFCTDPGVEAELTGVRAVPRAGTPEIPTSGVVRRFEPGTVQPGEYRLAVGYYFGSPADDMDDVGTWHPLRGADVTGTCREEEFDAFEHGGEEVVALLEVGAEGADVDRFELEATVDGRPHRLVIDGGVTICGTEVRGDAYDPDNCDSDD
ncbi:hypothetical protein [Nocardioides daphniae]|uniref:DUF4198 domain-containing protein n=1 Tax=Nocardioides daphniae TaxID=402297 RepID=A0ABQ1Q0Q3_9ACTN|nr:hypothetical protein [Nocardioides daphniae]GGD08120.1 hypothetical protein GCM10007231_03600 [Nocardioides daphniae]